MLKMSSMRFNACLDMSCHGLLNLFKDSRAVADSLVYFLFQLLHKWNKEKYYSMQLAASMLQLSFITPSSQIILVPVTKSNKLHFPHKSGN